MTIDELCNKIEAANERIVAKLDKISDVVARHDEAITRYTHDAAEIKSRMETIANKQEERMEKESCRITKLEQWKWFMLGAGAASGAVVGSVGANALKIFAN